MSQVRVWDPLVRFAHWMVVITFTLVSPSEIESRLAGPPHAAVDEHLIYVQLLIRIRPSSDTNRSDPEPS